MVRAGRRPAQVSVEEILRRSDTHRARLESQALEAASEQQRAGTRIHKAAAGIGVAVVVTGVVVVVSTVGASPSKTGSDTMFAWSLQPATGALSLPGTTPATSDTPPPGEPPGGGGLVGALVASSPGQPSTPSTAVTTTHAPAPDPAPAPGNPASPVPPVVTPTAAPSTCSVRYSIQNSWPGGFTASVVITNTAGTPWGSWTLGWTFGQGQRVTQGWNGTWSQYGSRVQVVAASWNSSVPAGGSVTTGFNGAFGGANPAPGAFTVNGKPCKVS